nr:LysM peptidoglycan-binding domain-containing protein [uncultured Marinifilum sp.]
MINLIQNRNLLLALLFVVCCFSSSTTYSQKTAKNIFKCLQKGELEKIVKLSAEEISTLEKADDLRSVGKILLEDLQYGKSAICYQQLLSEHKTSLLASDYMNYYFCLLNTGKQELVLKSGKQQVDSNKWVKMLKISARAQSYFASQEKINPLLIESNIYPSYGFSLTQDTLRYFTEKNQEVKDVLLEETATILNNKVSNLNSRSAVYQNACIKEVKGGSKQLKLNLNRFAGRQIFVLKQSKDIIYSVESFSNGRFTIKIKCDKLSPFTFNSQDYDCAMPFFDEKHQTLYYCSNKPGGFGSWDIYSSNYNNGKWNEPVNLGDQVNTPFTDIFPQISDYGLLFSTNGRIGAGGFDNYLFSFKDKIAHNLAVFNSPEDDFCLQEINNTSIGIQNGQLVDYQLSVKNFLSDIKKQEAELIAFLYPERLEAAKRSKVRQDSLQNVAKQIKLRKEKEEYEKKLVQWNSLKNLYYEIEQTNIKQWQKPRIDSIIQTISDLQVKQVYLIAYADGFGTSLFNRSIASKRAFSMMDYLASHENLKGVSFIPVIMGETLSTPDKSDCKTRKVEFKIAREAFSAKGLLAVLSQEEPDSILSQNYQSTDLPQSNKLKYQKVRAWHKVLAGETIGEISLKYNCPIQRIEQMNNINDGIIMLNEYLFIPEENITNLTKNNN